MTTIVQRRHLLGGALSMGVFPFFTSSLRAQAVDLPPAASVSRRTPRDAWEEWLQANRLSEGVSVGADRRDLRILMFSEAAVAEGPANRFLNRRGIAYNSAVLAAKAELSRTIATEIRSGQILSVVEQNREEAPPMLEQATRPVSTADRARRLADLTLDDQIRRFDPNWNGTGRSDDERRRRLVDLEQTYRNNLATRAELFTSGALSACVFEGTGPDGRYRVGVGVVWSLRTQRIAQAIIDPAVNLRGAPKSPIRDQIEDVLRANPDYLATAYGLQLTRDETGDPVILAIVSVDPSSSGFRNESLSRDLATQMLQTFVAEQTTAVSAAELQLTEQRLTDGRTEAFDSSAYRSEIQSVAPRMTISGLSVVKGWDGMHPAVRTPVYARVFAWSPSHRAASTAVQEMSDTQRRAVQSATGAPAAARQNTGASTGATAGGVQAVPTRRGQATNPSEF